jgi:hypothetical protein
MPQAPGRPKPAMGSAEGSREVPWHTVCEGRSQPAVRRFAVGPLALVVHVRDSRCLHPKCTRHGPATSLCDLRRPVRPRSTSTPTPIRRSAPGGGGGLVDDFGRCTDERIGSYFLRIAAVRLEATDLASFVPTAGLAQPRAEQPRRVLTELNRWTQHRFSAETIAAR